MSDRLIDEVVTGLGVLFGLCVYIGLIGGLLTYVPVMVAGVMVAGGFGGLFVLLLAVLICVRVASRGP